MPGEGPLAGIRVVELGAIGPDPHAAMILADLGADVVRIERPDAALRVGDEEHLDQMLRSRRRVRLDARVPAERAALHDLVDRADVLLDGFRPGVAERMGIGPAEAHARNPGLVYGRITGWGQEGPRTATAGHDINYLALTGALGALARGGEPPRAPLNLLDGGAPFYDTYACADGGWVAVGALEPAFFHQLIEGLGWEDAAAVAASQYDTRSWPALRARLAETFASRTREEWAGVFDGTDACVTPVLSLDEASRDPHLRARTTVVDADGVPQAAPAPRFSRTPAGEIIPPRSAPDDLAAVLADWSAPLEQQETR